METAPILLFEKTVVDYITKDTFDIKFSKDKNSFLLSVSDQYSRFEREMNFQDLKTFTVSKSFGSIADTSNHVVRIQYDCPFLFHLPNDYRGAFKYKEHILEFSHGKKKPGQETFSTLESNTLTDFSAVEIQISKISFDKIGSLTSFCWDLLNHLNVILNEFNRRYDKEVNLKRHQILSFKISFAFNSKIEAYISVPYTQIVCPDVTVRIKETLGKKIFISESFKGFVTSSLLVRNSLTFIALLKREDFENGKGGSFFYLSGFNYLIHLYARNGVIIFHKNGNSVKKNVHEEIGSSEKYFLLEITAGYDQISIRLSSKHSVHSTRECVKFAPMSVPLPLVKWVRKQSLIPVDIYSNKQKLVERAVSMFETLQEKLNEVPAHKMFYKNTKTPKREPDIRDMIIMLIHDFALNSSFEIETEPRTGVGNYDIKVTGDVENYGRYTIVVECKKDYPLVELVKGFTTQLPAYIENKGLDCGIYLVFHFKLISDPQLAIIDYILKNKIVQHPLCVNIRIIDLDLRIKPSASKIISI